MVSATGKGRKEDGWRWLEILDGWRAERGGGGTRAVWVPEIRRTGH